LQFNCNREINCFLINKHIKSNTYYIKTSLCFLALFPIKREIFAGDFSDRIIHHLIFNILNPHYNPLLINDCYSCRQSKGTDYGIKRVAKFYLQASNNYTKPAYAMKLDISGYFMNIDRNKLYLINKKLIRKIFKGQPEQINKLLYLLKKIIFNDPTKNCRIKGNKKDWIGLPKNKSLFYAQKNKGLPIGNLTSQLFGNIYLNEFDHFIKEKLKCRFYGRYVDDMVFVHHDKEFLKNLIPKINSYLKINLGLSLHPKKIYLQPIEKGVPFLGMIIKPYYIYPGKRLRRNFRQAILEASQNKRGLDSLNSYLGMMKNYNSYKLRKKYINSEIGQKALKALKAKINKDYTKIEKIF
jgi:RNA-directed DNA polymerase